MSSHVLHGVAWLSLRALSPLKAMSVTRFAGSFLPRLSKHEASDVAARLRGGTCLTRSMTIASRVRGASLVIGGEKKMGLRAHAWVEVEGRPLSGQTTLTDVLVRLAQ